MVRLVLGTQSLENQDRVLDGRSLDFDGLEAALESGVFLDVLAIFVESGRPDALKFTATECGLDDVGGIHGSFGGTGTDDGVHLVDEQDDVLVLTNLVHHRLDAFLKLTAVFRPGHHEREIECNDALAGEKLRHIARDNLLGEALGDGGLADTGLANKHRIILAAAAENLDDALNLLGPADHRIKFSLGSDFGQVAPKGFQCRGLAFLTSGSTTCGGFLSFVPFGNFPTLLIISGVKIRIEFLQHFIACTIEVDFKILENLGGDPLTFTEQTEKNMLGADIGMLERLRLFAGQGQYLLHTRRVGDIPSHLVFLTGANLLLDLLANRFQIQSHFLEHIHGHSLTKLDETEQQMLGPDVVVVEAVGFLA